MAKSHERKIVDVRDLFGQTKEKIDLSELDTSPRLSPQPSGFAGGLKHSALGAYTPKACQSTNDNVFFGDSSVENGSRHDNERRKGDAPRPPVLVDVDVGIGEQELDLDSDVMTPEPVESRSPWSFGSGASSGHPGPPVQTSRTRPAPTAGAGGHTKPGQFIMNGRAAGRGYNKYEGRPLPAPPSESPPSSPPPAPRQTHADHGRSPPRDVGGVMSNFSFGVKPPSNRPPPVYGGGHSAQADGGARVGGTGASGSAKSQVSLDQSSSGVETDDNGSPEGTVQVFKAGPTLGSRPAAPPPPTQVSSLSSRPPPPIAEHSQATDSSYHSAEGSDAEDEGSDYYEEGEATIDLEDEDETTIEGGTRHVYHEYQGDDFGQFLNEEHSQDSAAGMRGKKKRHRRKKRKEALVTPGNSASISSGEATTKDKKRTLRGRLAAVFMGNKAGDVEQRAAAAAAPNDKMADLRKRIEAGGTIHTFSFADSKIGNTLTRQGHMQGQVSQSGDDGTGGVQGLAPCDAAYGGDRKWWNTDMLSARQLQSNSDVMLMSRRAPAAPHTPAPLSQGELSLKETAPSPAPPSGIDSGSPSMDFESQRKSVMYGSHPDKKFQKQSIFRRFKKDTGNIDSIPDNTVTNPLAGLESDLKDIQF